jgi:CHASE2 domain
MPWLFAMLTQLTGTRQFKTKLTLALAEKHSYKGFEMYLYIFGALGYFSHNPINSSYLASIISKVSQANVKFIAVDYLLNKPSTNKFEDLELANSIRDSESRDVNFMFASKIKNAKNISIHSNLNIKSLHRTISGDMDYNFYNYENFPHYITSWNQEIGELVPFSYGLAVMMSSQDRMMSSQDRVIDRWNQNTVHNKIAAINTPLPWLTSLIIDYSWSPDRIYNRISARQLSPESPNLVEDIKLDLKDKVVLIAPGGYDDAGVYEFGEDNLPLPLAIKLRSILGIKNHRGVDYYRNNHDFTGSEVHAYTADQIANNSNIIRIQDSLIMIVAIIFIESAIVYKVYASKKVLIGSSTLYISLCISLYCIANISIPFLLPLAISFIYRIPFQKDKICV